MKPENTPEDTRQEFIGNYLSKKMKDHGLPYGIAYINLLAKHEEIAEKKYIEYKNAQKSKQLKLDKKQ